jgi:hypothetical protein
MEIVYEQEKPYRGGASGVKYLVRGPRIDWGVIIFAPGEQMGRHMHKEVEETFYIVEGTGGRFVVNDQEHPIRVGMVVRLEPGEATSSTIRRHPSRLSSSSRRTTRRTRWTCKAPGERTAASGFRAGGSRAAEIRVMHRARARSL